MRVFCKKSGAFLNARCIMYSISIFYFTFYHGPGLGQLGCGTPIQKIVANDVLM